MNKFEVIIVGGSYAGLSAAMALGRALRNVLVIDGGDPCNIQTPHSHNFLTRDGETPAQLAAISKAQAFAYPTVSSLNANVLDVKVAGNEFTVSTNSGVFVSQKLLFATGLMDLLPPIPGFAESWGISIVHCPYCHGYEIRGAVTGVLANGQIGFEFVRFIQHWTKQVTLLTNGPAELTGEQKSTLSAMKIDIVENPIERIDQQQGKINFVKFADGTEMILDALYAKLPFVQKCTIPLTLGCEANDMNLLKVDDFQKTNLPGVFAAGDCTTMMRSVSSAVAAGTKAGAFINHELIQESLNR